MESKTAQEIFRLFDLSKKTEDQILAIIQASHYSPEVCCLGISFLKNESNILMIMEKTSYNPKVCAVGVKALKLGSKTENQILTLLEEINAGDTQECVRKLCIPYFKLKQKKEYEILNLLKKTKWNYFIKKAAIEALKVENKTDEQLVTLMEITDYQSDVCALCMKHLKKDENIIALMTRESTPYFIQIIGASRLNWKNKTTEQIMEILVGTDYNHDVSLAAVPYIKTVKEILLVIKYSANSEDICTIGINNLKLSEKAEDKLLWLMKESGYNYYVCCRCLELLSLNEKTDDQLLSIMFNSDYNEFVCATCIIHLKSEYDVHQTIKKTKFKTTVCLAGLPRLSLQSDIINVLADSCYEDNVCVLGISLLKSENLIFDTMEKANYSSPICDAAVERLKVLKS